MLLPCRLLAVVAPFLFLLSLFSCKGRDTPSMSSQQETDPSPLSDATSVGHINLDGSLSRKERGAFVAAMDYLDQSQVTNANPQLLQMMGIASFDSFTVRQWLEDRIEYIVPESVNVNQKLGILQKNYTNYENPGVFPPGFSRGQQSLNDSKGQVIMSNLGAIVYLTAKDQGWLVGLHADGVGTVPFTSPRVGLLQVGSGLFLLPANLPNLVKIFHLTTLIHESRHSDGNRTGTGFLHDKCPSGDYAGELACDHNSNGPYEIEALATKEFLLSCASCSTRERQVLRLLYGDVSSREIIDATTTAWDPTPEGKR